jgi:hypothetical protein
MHGDEPQVPVEGSVTDRPWGITLATLGTERRTGQLTLRDDGRELRIEFERGLVVGATSPLAVDSASRIALTMKLITPAQASEVKRRGKLARDRDELELIAEVAQLAGEVTARLGEEVVVRCAARTFAIDQGRYVLEVAAPPAVGRSGVDIRRVVYRGVRMNLSDERLAFDLRQLGTWFVLKPKTVDDLSGFGFTKIEAPILEALRGGTNLASLEARHREIDPRTAQAVIYALAACDAVVCSEPPARGVTTVPPPTRAVAVAAPFVPDLELELFTPSPDEAEVPARDETKRISIADSEAMFREPPTESMGAALTEELIRKTELADPIPVPRLATRKGHPTGPPMTPAPPARHRTETSPPLPIPERLPPPPAVGTAPPPPRQGAAFETSPWGVPTLATTTVRPNALQKQEVEALIAERTAWLARGVDHFTLLGVDQTTPLDQIRAAYIELARNLEPQRLAELGISDQNHDARALFAQVCIAITVLGDAERRREYIAQLAAGTAPAFTRRR